MDQEYSGVLTSWSEAGPYAYQGHGRREAVEEEVLLALRAWDGRRGGVRDRRSESYVVGCDDDGERL